MRETIGSAITRAAFVSFLAHIVLAAAAYGLTRETTVNFFNASMGLTILVWIIGCVVAGRRPRLGILAPLLIGLILAFGWIITLGFLVDPTVEDSLPAPDWLAYLAGEFATFDAKFSLASMIRTSTLLGAMMLAIDLFDHDRWTKALLATVAMTAISMVGWFFLQKIAPDVFTLRAMDGVTPLSFASYRYWGNGASFLNLLWPALAGIAVHLGITRGRGWSLWLAAALLVFSALYVNFSKAGQVLGVIGLFAFAVVILPTLLRSGRHHFSNWSWRVVAAGAIPVVILLAALSLAMPWGRWSGLIAIGVEGNERTISYRYYAPLVSQAGWTGFGPGTFEPVCIAHLTQEQLLTGAPIWVAHQDYLQTLVETGYLGASLWAALLLPGALGLLTGALRTRNSSDPAESYEFCWMDRARVLFDALPDRQSPALLAGASVAVFLTALHAAVDFPMQVESLQFYFLIWIALGWRNVIDRPASSRRRRRRAALAA